MQDLKKLVASKKFNKSSISAFYSNLMKSKNIKKIQDMLTYLFSSLPIDQINQLVPDIPAMIIKKLQINESRQICQLIISKIKPEQQQSTQVILLESIIRQELSEIFSAKGFYDMAAMHLSKAYLEHPARGLSDEQKASKFISIAEFNLQMENTANADYYLNKVSALPSVVLDSIQQNLRFNVCFAREQDLKRNFHAAALNFYRLSNSPGVDENDLLEIFKMSATCALLLNAGPKKSRLIATLMKDQRMSADFIPHYEIIEALHENKVVKLKTLKELEPLFKQHQLVKGKFEMNLLELVMIQHNLLSLGQYFENISLQRMGKMVGLDKVTTQDILATMIEDGRVDAVIDEIDGMVEFEARDPGVRDDMLWKQLEDKVGCICKAVQDVIDQIQRV